MNKLINIIKDGYKYFVFCLIFIIINRLFCNNIFHYNQDLTIDKSNIKLIITINAIIMSLLLFILYKKKIKLENIFLIFSVIIGSAYLILIPIGLVPDESAHFARTYEIASFHLISDVNEEGMGGRILPVEIYDHLAQNADYTYKDVISNLKKENSGNLEFLKFPNTSLYNFVCYIPQSIGVFVGKILNLPITLTAYLGRITNFIVWTILMYFSIKYIPFCKKTLIFISFLPITLQEAISLSPDSLTIGVSALLFSYIMYITYGMKDKINIKQQAILVILTIVMSMCKIIYLPLCLLLFLIPKERFKNKKEKYIKILSLIIFVIVINLLWLKFSSSYLVEFQEGVNSLEQIKFILKNPIMYIQIIFDSLIQNMPFYIFTMVGKGLEWFNIDLSYIYPFITIVILSIIIYENKNINLNVKLIEKLWILFIIFDTIILIFTSLYVQWTPVGNLVVNGVQGRYFIPLLFIIPFIFIPVNNSQKNHIAKLKNDGLYLYGYLIFQNIYVLMFIYLNHL